MAAQPPSPPVAGRSDLGDCASIATLSPAAARLPAAELKPSFGGGGGYVGSLGGQQRFEVEGRGHLVIGGGGEAVAGGAQVAQGRQRQPQ